MYGQPRKAPATLCVVWAALQVGGCPYRWPRKVGDTPFKASLCGRPAVMGGLARFCKKSNALQLNLNTLKYYNSFQIFFGKFKIGQLTLLAMTRLDKGTFVVSTNSNLFTPYYEVLQFSKLKN